MKRWEADACKNTETVTTIRLVFNIGGAGTKRQQTLDGTKVAAELGIKKMEVKEEDEGMLVVDVT